jgi:hypothetical protein
MSAAQGKKLATGLVLMVSFLGVLTLIFMPIFGGGNALDYLDNLYNSISKASAYYIPKVTEEVQAWRSDPITAELGLGGEELAQRAAAVVTIAGVSATIDGGTVTVAGDLRAILAAALEDADSLYHNRGEEVTARRGGIEARSTVHAWYKLLAALERELTRQKRFDDAKLIHTVKTRAVECAYNYHGIEPQPIGERWGIVLLSLVFYVVYTVWYGYGVMFLFEGLGYRLTH